MRLGVAPYTELFFTVPDYIYAIGGNVPTGSSDFVASAKFQFPRLFGFHIGAIAGLSFPNGGSQISTHGCDPLLQLPWKYPIGEHWAAEGMFATTWLTTEPHDSPTFESTFEIERKIGTWANLIVEYAVNYPRHARPTDLFDGAALLRPIPRQQLDLYPGFGINRPTSNNFLGLGYSLSSRRLF